MIMITTVIIMIRIYTIYNGDDNCDNNVKD